MFSKPSAEALEHRRQIETLARVNEDNTRKYEALVKALDKVDLVGSGKAEGTASSFDACASSLDSSTIVTTPALQTSSETQPPHETHFEKILMHLQRAIDSIETAEKELESPFDLGFKPHIFRLSRCHEASSQAKRALQEASNDDTSNVAPRKRQKFEPDETPEVRANGMKAASTQDDHPSAGKYS